MTAKLLPLGRPNGYKREGPESATGRVWWFLARGFSLFEPPCPGFPRGSLAAEPNALTRHVPSAMGDGAKRRVAGAVRLHLEERRVYKI